MSDSRHSKRPNGVPTKRYSKVIASTCAELGCPEAKREIKRQRRRIERRACKIIRSED
jgi:hypothetical protein